MADFYDRAGNPIEDAMEWARVFEAGDRTIASDTLPDQRWLSTVWLGIDHSFGVGRPKVFETMLFSRKENLSDVGCWRWSTEDEAKEGHGRILAALHAGQDPDEVD